ncbi:MAG: sigma-70 family RNA polymerase sigma factor [Candidatus Acidiferrum sp.]
MTEHRGSPREGDAEAIELTLAGDRNAYRVLVERHSASVFRLAYRLTGNRHDAEEVVQEGFLRAYQKLEQFEKRANFGTWVYRIAANYAIDRMRQKRSEEARREQPSSRTPESAPEAAGIGTGNADAGRAHGFCDAALARVRH